MLIHGYKIGLKLVSAHTSFTVSVWCFDAWPSLEPAAGNVSERREEEMCFMCVNLDVKLLDTGLCNTAVRVTGEQQYEKTIIRNHDYLIFVQLVGHVPVVCLDIWNKKKQAADRISDRDKRSVGGEEKNCCI